MFVLVFLSFLITLNLQFDRSSAQTTADYCELCSDHTMCIYTSGPAGTCGQVTITSLTEQEMTAIVNRHNLFRQNVAAGNESRGNPGPQPAAIAGAMEPLVWDSELATIAQRWANQCADGHDSCRNVERFFVGQNVASSTILGSGPIPTVLEQMRMWENEVPAFNRNYVSSYRYNVRYAEYSQLVWGKTMRVGCERIGYNRGGGNQIVNLICNYGSGGNLVGQQVYETSP